MALHLLVTVSLIALTLLRHRFPIKFKLNYVLLLTSLISVVGVYNWGLLGNGILWSILAIIFVTLYYGIKLGIIASLCFFCYVSFIAFLYIQGIIVPQADPAVYVVSLSGWLTGVIGALLPLSITVVVIGTLYEAARDSLKTLEKQKVDITILAERDDLTGIYNSRVFHNMLDQAIERSKRHGSWVYLVNIDLDNFKDINDSYGHHAGDAILRYMAKQLLNVTRGEDTLCRVGGDEFLMLIDSPEKHSKEELNVVVERLKAAIEIPYIYEKTKLSIRGSIGYAEYNAKATPSIKNKDDLLKQADREMFKDKERTRAQQTS
ncbi:GGDEF domain-containing protein [Kangiella marina]|uniref:GGDEF domain-containing protein n=1 Tax=Kangiella marina TaxID=1079178 RepID=UPI0031F15E41